jgi:thiol-disulfide isomerase/thioredoxin
MTGNMAKQNKASTAVPEPTEAAQSNQWQWQAALALCAAGFVSAAIPFEGQPGFELSFPVTPMLRLWLLLGFLGALFGAVGPKAMAPEWLQGWSNEEKRREILGRYALQSIAIRSVVVLVAAQFFAVPLHPVRSLALGVALFAVEFLYEAIAYTLFQKKPANGRRWVWSALAIFLVIGIIDAYLSDLRPWSHWFATIVHLFSAPVWYLIPTIPAFLSLANDAIQGNALLSFLPFVLFSLAALALLYKPKVLALAISAAVVASILGAIPLLKETPDEQEAKAGALAAKNPPPAWRSRKAPELRVSSFTGDKAPSLADYTGKVKVFFFFQSFCPGCLSRGFPVTRRLEAKYEESQAVQFVYLQTTFELASVNTWEEAKEEAESWNVLAPVAQDEIDPRTENPITMGAYGSRGTPWTIVIDKDDRVRFSGITPEYAFLEALVAAIEAE